MKYKSVEILKKALIGMRIAEIKVHGGHGMILSILAIGKNGMIHTADICTYDDGKQHDVDEFYVALDGKEL